MGAWEVLGHIALRARQRTVTGNMLCGRGALCTDEGVARDGGSFGFGMAHGACSMRHGVPFGCRCRSPGVCTALPAAPRRVT